MVESSRHSRALPLAPGGSRTKASCLVGLPEGCRMNGELRSRVREPRSYRNGRRAGQHLESEAADMLGQALILHEQQRLWDLPDPIALTLTAQCCVKLQLNQENIRASEFRLRSVWNYSVYTTKRIVLGIYC